MDTGQPQPGPCFVGGALYAVSPSALSQGAMPAHDRTGLVVLSRSSRVSPAVAQRAAAPALPSAPISALAAESAAPVHQISATDAWDLLQAEDTSVLIDVRTHAEWAFVGVPDLSSVSRPLHLLEWQSYPDMAQNMAFCDDLSARLNDAGDIDPQGRALVFLCRVGGRSHAAALAMAARGYRRCFNVFDGFEGDLSPQRRRGQVSGWKAAGLPWIQT